MEILDCPFTRTDTGISGIVEILVFRIIVDDVSPLILSTGGFIVPKSTLDDDEVADVSLSLM